LSNASIDHGTFDLRATAIRSEALADLCGEFARWRAVAPEAEIAAGFEAGAKE
jgi:hypothetical protein